VLGEGEAPGVEEPAGGDASASANASRAISTEVAIASPSAVPPLAIRESIASWISLRSSVGVTTTRGSVEKTMSPIRNDGGSLSTKAEAACWAAARRDGSTSVARIDRETSIVRMIVASSRGTAIIIDGRASARTSAPIAAR
jgi:hypothetical protein